MERLPPYDLIDLRLLVALAEHRHFARAAEACALSQPALSSRIRRLETALDTPLIFRGKRFEGFTPEGEKALEWARRILSDCSGLVQDLKDDVEGPKGILRLGVVPSATPYAGQLCGALASFYPNVKVQVLSMSSKALDAGITDFSLDAAITYHDAAAKPVASIIPLFEETYCLVARPEVVGRGAGLMTWEDAAKLPLCLLTEDMQNRRIIDQVFNTVGCSPEPRLVANSFNALFALVRQHAFATILPRVQIDAGLTDDLGVWDLVAPVHKSFIGLAVADRDPMLPVTRALVDFLAKNPLV